MEEENDKSNEFIDPNQKRDPEELVNQIPLDDIFDYYQRAPDNVKQAVSLLLQRNDNFYLFTRKHDPLEHKITHAMSISGFCSLLWNVVYDFIQRYGHIDFFELLLEYMEANTHITMATILYNGIYGTYFDPNRKIEAEEEEEEDDDEDDDDDYGETTDFEESKT